MTTTNNASKLLINNSIEKQAVDENSKDVILDSLPNNMFSIIIIFRWLEFLMERIKRSSIIELLEYYQSINWISEDIKIQLLKYMRGEVQDVFHYDQTYENEGLFENDECFDYDNNMNFNMNNIRYKKLSDWRLSAEDHLKSLIFIYKLKGLQINHEELTMLENEINKMLRKKCN